MSTQIIYEPRGRAREYAPLAANLYAGCSHGCTYCYACGAVRRKKEDFHTRVSVRDDVLRKLERDAIKLQGDDRTVLLSFTTDPYQPCESETKVTRRAIQILHRYDLRVELLTKGGTRAARDFDLLTAADRFASSLTFLDDADSAAWEPNAALPSDRIDAIREAKRRGLTTWASLEPVIDPEQSLEIIRATSEVVDLYKVGTLNHHPAGASIDWADFGRRAIALLESLGAAYYIKADLRKHIERGTHGQ